MDALTARLRLGDTAALEEVMDRYAPYAAKIIAVFCGGSLPPEDMEEALSDVFVRLWDHRASLQGDVKPYLATIARNAARDRLRRFRPAEPLDLALADKAPGPQELTERSLDAQALRAALALLPREEGELLWRFYFLDQTAAEIARSTGQNPATIRSRLHRGRQKLKEILKERGLCYE